MYIQLVQDLHDAHRKMEYVLTLIRLHVDALQSPDNAPGLAFLNNAIHYMHEYPRLNHHAVEDVIFGRLVQYTPDAEDLCTYLSGQHSTFGQQETTLLQCIQRARTGDYEAYREVRKIGKAYCEAHALHIRSEETDALPQAAESLKEADWKQVVSQTESVLDPFENSNKLKNYEDLYNYLLTTGNRESSN